MDWLTIDPFLILIFGLGAGAGFLAGVFLMCLVFTARTPDGPQ